MKYTVTTIMHFEEKDLAIVAEKSLQMLHKQTLAGPAAINRWLAASFHNADTVTTCTTFHLPLEPNQRYQCQVQLTEDGQPI